MRPALLSIPIVLLLSVPSVADEKLAGIACRSVHLGYPAPSGTAYYNEATITHSAEGTYFAVCGFSKGYFGIQELTSGKKLVIFSVWDPTAGNDAKSVPEEKRVKLLHKGDGVRTGRFGGEGTGGQSFFDYDWKIGETYRFYVTAEPETKDRTTFTGYFYLNDKKEWKKLVSFSTETGGTLLGGYHSFVEDFRRNKISLTKARRAEFGNGWVKPSEGDWIALDKATFTGDSNPATNIDAGPLKGKFFLATGGETKNETTKLRAKVDLDKSDRKPPNDLPK